MPCHKNMALTWKGLEARSHYGEATGKPAAVGRLDLQQKKALCLGNTKLRRSQSSFSACHLALKN